MKRWLMLLLCITLPMTACTDETRSARVLHEAGFEPVRFTGYEMFDCGKDDTVRTGFVAKNVKGERVVGTVCCGLVGKNCTIRFE